MSPEPEFQADNPVSPKITVVFIVGLLATILQVAVTQEWNAGEWFTSVGTLLQVAAGYFKTDPLRERGKRK